VTVDLHLHILLPFLYLTHVCDLLQSLQTVIDEISQVYKDLRVLCSTKLWCAGLNVFRETHKKSLLKSNSVCLTDKSIAE